MKTLNLLTSAKYGHIKQSIGTNHLLFAVRLSEAGLVCVRGVANDRGGGDCAVWIHGGGAGLTMD
jgi:hypothetical protein